MRNYELAQDDDEIRLRRRVGVGASLHVGELTGHRNHEPEASRSAVNFDNVMTKFVINKSTAA